jgi:hypothetical protein
MPTKNLNIGVLVLILIVLIGGFVFLLKKSEPSSPAPANQTSSNADDVEVRRVVTEFGATLQKVSLLASTADRKAAMELHYAPYVSPELIAAWIPEGKEALGRYASSPWPERIDIVEVREENNYFVVEGNVIEVVNGEEGTTPAAVYPVTLTLEKISDKWLITKMNKGAYSELPQRRTIVGYWECLPHKDRTGPQTLECAFGIAVDQSDGHYAVDTRLMGAYPIDFPTGTKVRVSGVVTPADQLSSTQKYDIDGIIRATVIEKI